MSPQVDMTMQEIFQLAQMLVQTQGILPQTIRTAGECVAVILAGRELGFPPMVSLRLISLVKGKVTIDASGQLGLMQRAGAKIEWLKDGTDGDEAHLRVTRPGDKPFDTKFNMAMAKTAGLLGNGTWQKFPDKMLRARCVSAVGKAYYADVLAGIYIPGEIDGDDRPEDGLMLPPGTAHHAGGGRPMLSAEARVVPAHIDTLPAPGGVPALTAGGAAATPTGRTITDVLADINACDDIAAFEPLRLEARALFKTLDPALQTEVTTTCKNAPQKIAERQAARLEAEEADRALGASTAEPGASDAELDPVDAAIAQRAPAPAAPVDQPDIEGVF